jgi:hypothetical protein
MDVKERPEAVQNQINNCLKLIDDDQIEAASTARRKLKVKSQKSKVKINT